MTQSPLSSDTICALATAPGGALGIIRLSGPNALAIAATVCHPKRIAASDSVDHGSSAAKPSTARLVHIYDGSTLLDEAILTTFHSPHSYTGEDAAEFSCHGSPYILNKVLDLLVHHGCRMANPGEFTQRAFLNGKMDLSQAEAVADLIASTNRASHDIALSQLRGQLSSELSKLREQLLNLTSLLELELDFSDHEDLEFADRTELLQLAETINHRVVALAKSFETGQALKSGIPVAIIGAPNVGKSTLLNALLGEERAIVSNIEGTTRDTIEDVMTLDGIQFRFIDTAGLRKTNDQIEQLGIERTLQATQKARIILLVTEPGVPFPDIDVRPEQHVIRIKNKTPQFQALHGIGLPELKQQLLTLVPHPDDNDIIVTSARHFEALTHAHEHLSHVLDGLHNKLSGDLLSEDLRLVLSDLAEITGSEGIITSQETLNNIFSRFCIGK